MIALDTNVLVYAYTREDRVATIARHEIRCLAEGPEPWAIPWPCVYEYLRVTTHPAIARPPAPAHLAWQRLRTLTAAPGLIFLSETPRHADILDAVLDQSGACGNNVHDAHIWTLCLEHGVTELLSGDRGFTRFRGLRLRNPFA